MKSFLFSQVISLMLLDFILGSDLPHINIGPYNPWRWDKGVFQGLKKHNKVSSPHPQDHHGYETDIIIDPHSSKVSIIIVKIIFSIVVDRSVILLRS